MNAAAIDILRAELERLFSLDELTSMSERFLGLDPEDVGGAAAKATFAHALAERCVDADRIDALVEVILASRQGVDPRVRDAVGLLGKEELPPGAAFGPFTGMRKLGEGDLAIVYTAHKENDEDRVVKVLRREAVRDRRAVQRFLAATRLAGEVAHDGLPEGVETGEADGTYWVSYLRIEAQPLSTRFARTGPQHINEARPLLRGILEPLVALHDVRLAHGAVKMENVLVGRPQADGAPHVLLVDFGTDRLRLRHASTNGHGGGLALFGSPKTIAPEQVRGRAAEPATDVYAFGALLYELLSGKPVFPYETATDAALAHVARLPEPPSSKAPRGWISRELDEFVLSLLAKEPQRRPKDAGAVLDELEVVIRASSTSSRSSQFSEVALLELSDALASNPTDAETALQLEAAIDEGADPAQVAAAFESAALTLEAEGEGLEAKKNLLFRAGRIYGGALRDRERAEKVYSEIVELDPSDELAQTALDDVRKALGKYGEIVESLMTRSEQVEPGEARARLFAEIGRLCATELDDPEQGVLAYAQALCQSPLTKEYAEEIERLAAGKPQLWNEVLSTMTGAIQGGESLGTTERNALLLHAGRWYEEKIGRADLGIMALQQVLASDPANDGAHEGLTNVYRRAQQWPELASTLVARADLSGSAPRARDLRAEAAQIYESRLNDTARAKELFHRVLAEDPAHQAACDGLAGIAERTGDYKELAQILERQVESRRGRDQSDALIKIAEVYEDRLEDLAEATRRFEAALALDPHDLQALKGLDRIYNRQGKYKELLENLEHQVALAATPRQKIGLYERIAALYDEEFLDHEGSAEVLEGVLQIDPSNDSAMTALARQYRVLDRWDKLEKLYEKHANMTGDEARRLELTLHRARVLAENLGAVDRAMEAYERVLELQPEHPGALEALVRLRERSGDSHAALAAIEALAAKAVTPEAKAEQWVRAARLLEGAGDKDGAIERYKAALGEHPRDLTAFLALRAAYQERGEGDSLVALIEHALEYSEAKVARARLHAELARVRRDMLHESERAEAHAKTALELDPTNSEAILVLGDIAFEEGRFVEAAKYLETLVGRASALGKDDAVRMLVRYVEAYEKSTARTSSPSGREAGARDSGIPPAPSNPRLVVAVQAIEQTAPEDGDSLARVARVVFDSGSPADAQVARGIYERILAKDGPELMLEERSEAEWRYGELLRRAGELDRAVDHLRSAAEADPSRPEPLQALARVFETTGDWEEFVRTKRRRLEVAAGSERFDLLLEIGDAEFQKLNDRTRATKTYVAALEERPDDRKLLTKLMQLYSEEKDWAKLVEVVLRLADFVEDSKQRAKYMHTAAIVSARQLGETEQAITFYERAIDYDPTLTKPVEELTELYAQVGNYEGVERVLNAQLDSAKDAGDRPKMVGILDRMGALYRSQLNDTGMAIDAYEAAQAFDPDGKERAEILAELYASNPSEYLDKAVKAQAQILRRNPYRVESYKLLRRLYTEARKPDPAWCLCQALAVLNLAEPDEERFYRRHRAENAAPAQAVLSEEDWTAWLAHADADPLLTRVFAAIQPTIIRARTQPLEALGYTSDHQIDLGAQDYPVVQTLYYVQGVLGFPAPPIFQNPNDPAGLGFLHAHTPSIVLGRAAFESNVPTQSLAFVAGRHMTYFRPGFYVRHLVPTGTGLKAWLFAAIKLCVPQFPVAPDLEGQVSDAMAVMAAEFQGVHREMLASTVSKLLQSGGAIDLKKWVAAIDLTADRAGFVLAHDLAVASEVMRATEDASSVAAKERIKEIVLFSISEEYLALREKLAITIES
jgi:tetratricopeptide (TPR) repeat protein